MTDTKPNTIYPTYKSLDEVVEMANCLLPIKGKNQLYAIIMTYHNTLLSLINKENQPK